MPKEDYESFRDLTRAIAKKIDTKRSFVVGIGRGPTPVIAILQEWVPGSAANVPFSAPATASGEILPYDPSRHFDEMKALIEDFLPPEVLSGRRKIAVLDEIIEGGSLHFFASALKDYFHRRGLSPELVAVGMEEGASPKVESRFKDIPYVRIELRAHRLAAVRLHGGDYKAWAEYENPEEAKQNGRSLTPRPEYMKLREEIASHVVKDKTLPRQWRESCRKHLQKLRKPP